VEMTLDSLRTFLRVRLYTAISLTVDIVDTTEMAPFPDPGINRSYSAPALLSSYAQIPLHRLPGTAPVRYQSAIALKLAARMKESPLAIAQQICDAYDTSAIPYWRTSIEANVTGWLILSLDCTDLTEFLNQSLTVPSRPLNVEKLEEKNLPFLIWHTYQRCRSLRSHLKRSGFSRFSGFSGFQEVQWGVPQGRLVETLLDWMDQADEADELNDRSKSSWLSSSAYQPSSYKLLLNLCQAFDQLHRQVPLFHPATPREAQIQFLQCLDWVQWAIERAVLSSE
jgi:hypothetical protein